MAVYQTNAIILKRENIFEADRLYYLYTEDFGKVRAIAGSVRKINAKLSGHLEPFNIVWVELATKKNGDLFITTALSLKKFLNQNVSPAQIALFAKMADFACLMLKGPQKDEILWNYILENFTKAGLVDPALQLKGGVEAGVVGSFLNEFKTGFIKILGFGDNLEEALWYNY
ncbi:MAG: recombination protein O N-terminal domain-containing protein [bacterium]|nr:recombination protein O N-terminal domain-containing protein [bacterium]